MFHQCFDDKVIRTNYFLEFQNDSIIIYMDIPNKIKSYKII